VEIYAEMLCKMESKITEFFRLFIDYMEIEGGMN
jgi:hypothetical protein